MTYKLWEILVPCQWNDGTPIRTRHHKAWDEKVRRISGGLTVLKPGFGTWTNENTVYRERVIPVRIMCNDTDMDQIIDITLLHYEQLAVMVYVISEQCRIFEATDAQKAKFQR
jgi:hypothetical protein